ncbi:MAG: transketolase [Chlamydiota bacterium]
MYTISLENISKKIRSSIIDMSFLGKAPHLGSALSCVDILVALYWNFLQILPQNPHDRLRDRFILSKGHAIAALYAILAHKGFFPLDLLSTFNKNGSSLPEHPSPKCVPGLEAATGSLGHGLSLGIGHALAGKILQESYRVVVLLGDGECNEGTIWEAALFAPSKKLDNLLVFIDYNKWQATDRSEEVLEIAPLQDKWKAFGWNTFEIDGHDYGAISQVFNHFPSSNGKPTAVIAHTIKGKGISFMEDDNNWHYRLPTEEEVIIAKKELGL